MKLFHEFEGKKPGAIVRIESDRAKITKIEKNEAGSCYWVESEDWGRAMFCFDENGNRISRMRFLTRSNAARHDRAAADAMNDAYPDGQGA